MKTTVSVAVEIDRSEAIRQGRAQFGRVVVEIDPAQLTQDERDVLATSSEDHGVLQPLIFCGTTHAGPIIGNAEDPMSVVRGILEARKIWLADDEKNRAERKLADEKRQAEYCAEYESKCSDPENWIKANRRSERPVIDEPYYNSIIVRDLAKTIWDMPNIVAARAAAEKIVAQRIAEKIQHYTQHCAVAKNWIDKDGDVYRPDGGWLTREEEDAVLDLPASIAAKSEAEKIIADREAKKQVAADLRQAQIDAWVAEHGNDNQRGRHALKLLPEDEVLDAMRDAAYAPLGEMEKYTKLTADDVDHDEEYCHGSIGYDVADAPNITAEQWDAMARVRSLIPDAVVTVRRHTATCDECDAEEIRDSLRVQIIVGEIQFSREYAI